MPLHVLCFEALVAFDQLEVDYFSFRQRFVSFSLNGRIVDEDVFAGFMDDETEPFFVVKPLYFATHHTSTPVGQDAALERRKKSGGESSRT
jgi:hypothetical protein